MRDYASLPCGACVHDVEASLRVAVSNTPVCLLPFTRVMSPLSE